MTHYTPRQEKRFMIKDNNKNNQGKKQNLREMQERKNNNEQEIA